MTCCAITEELKKAVNTAIDVIDFKVIFLPLLIFNNLFICQNSNYWDICDSFHQRNKFSKLVAYDGSNFILDLNVASHFYLRKDFGEPGHIRLL